jgi:hypothetical protein
VTYKDSEQSDEDLDGYNESSTDDSSSSSDSSDDDDDDDDGTVRSVGTHQARYDIMPMPQPEVDPNPAPAMIDPDPPANQLDDDGSVNGPEPDENPGVEGTNLGPDELGLDENAKDPTNPGVEPGVEEEGDRPMDEHEQFRAAEAEGQARALADDHARPQRTVRPRRDHDFVYMLIQMYLGSVSDANTFVTAQMSAKAGIRHFGWRG